MGEVSLPQFFLASLSTETREIGSKPFYLEYVCSVTRPPIDGDNCLGLLSEMRVLRLTENPLVISVWTVNVAITLEESGQVGQWNCGLVVK